MNPITVCCYRIFQKGYHWALYLIPFLKPRVIKGPDSLSQVGAKIKEYGATKVLIVTDAGIVRLGLLSGLLESLHLADIDFVVFDQVVANPTVANIEAGVSLYLSAGCNGLVAIGGGSVMDCAKVVGARIVRPNRTVNQMKGYVKVLRKLPLLVAIATTAGTGSETTVAAVIVDDQTRVKYAINDPFLVPKLAVLDPLLCVGLPHELTATTGMDALTHAVEAFLGGSNTKQTAQDALLAVRLIYQYLPIAYQEPNNIGAREAMLEASFLAGKAFTRAFVGYVHAIAHTLGGQYDLPHGLCNAIVMPYVLEAYGSKAHNKLAILARIVGLTGSSDQALATSMIASIRTLNLQFGIGNYIKELRTEDIDRLVLLALHEAHPMYPVPKILSKQQIKSIYERLMG
jgi:alcohol dehydrogenase